MSAERTGVEGMPAGGLPEARSWDAVVVGAGPAGGMVAHELARAGAGVLLVDRQPLPRWKVCGCCLSPTAQAVLHEAGLAHVLERSGAVPLGTLRLAGWSRMADIPLGLSVALSRNALDLALAREAVAAGAVFLAPARARLGPCRDGRRSLFLEHPGGVTEARARVVVAADGLGSPLLAEALGHRREEGVAPGARIGFGAVFPASTPGYGAGVIHMAVGRSGYVGAVRLEDGSLDVASALDPAGLGGGERPEAAVQRILEEAGFSPLPGAPVQGWRGTPRLTRAVPTRGAERLFAVGDAAGYVEPFTGEGMGWALAGARALAPIALEAIRSWDPGLVRRWGRAHDDGVGRSARLCRSLAWTLRRPAVVRRAFRVLARHPGLAAPAVSLWARIPPSPPVRSP